MNQEELENLFEFGIVEIYEILQDHKIDINNDEAIVKFAEEIEC